MKNNNTSIIYEIANSHYKVNKSRNAAAVCAIALTAIMFTTVFTIGFSMLQSMAALGSGMSGGLESMLIIGSGILMILISGYLIIYNIFQISVSQDIRFYGMLKTLGATKRQIGRIITANALKMFAVGILPGLVIGYGIGALIMPVMLVSIGSDAVLSINPLIFTGAAVFTLFTVLMSCRKPIKIASKVSPIAALRYTDGDDISGQPHKGVESPTNPRTMAWENLKRNKKRTVTVILSVSLGLMLMNSFYVLQHSFSGDTYVRYFIQSDVMIMSEQGISDAEAANIELMPEINESGRVYCKETEEQLNDEVCKRIISYYDEEDSGQAYWVQNNEAANKQFFELKQTGKTIVNIYGLDPFTAAMGKVYLGEYDEDKFRTGEYVIAFGLADNGEGSVHYEIGDEITIEGRPYKLMAMVQPPETVKNSGHSKENELDISYAIYADAFCESFPDSLPVSILMDTSDIDSRNSLYTNLSHTYPDIETISYLQFETQFQSQVMAQVVMGYTLGIVMALIGVLNFANSMLSAVIARKHEFAVLESIGMTKYQLKKMLIHEGLNYAVITLILSVALAVIAATIVIQEQVSTSWAAAYHFSLMPFIIITPIFLALAVTIPIVCYRGTQQKSLVERLRESVC